MSILEEIKVNRAPTHMVRTPSLTLSKEARQSMGKYTPRTKEKGEALKREADWRGTTYRTGDGDHTAQVPRAGSMDAYALPSRGNRT
jgi:hypothetical protein